LKNSNRILRRRYRLKPEVCQAIMDFLEKRMKKNRIITKENILKIISKAEKENCLCKKRSSKFSTIDAFIQDVHDRFEKNLKI